MMITAQQIAEAGQVTPAYARMILAGSRTPSLATALRIYDATGSKLGPIANLDAQEVEAARKMTRAA